MSFFSVPVKPVHYYVNVFYFLYFYLLVMWLCLDCFEFDQHVRGIYALAVYFIKLSESLSRNIAAGYSYVDLSSWYCGSKVHSFGQWATANCAAPPNASAGQYAISSCKLLLFRFPCKWRYINIGTFNLREVIFFS